VSITHNKTFVPTNSTQFLAVRNPFCDSAWRNKYK